MATQTIRFEYVRSATLRQRALIETGIRPDSIAKVDLDLTTEPVDLRRELVESLGEPERRYSENVFCYALRMPNKVHISDASDYRVRIESESLVMDKDLTGLVQLQPLFAAWREANAQATALQPESERKQEQREAARAAFLEEERRRKEEQERWKEQERARKEAAAEAFRIERDAWAAERGTEHLRRAVAAGYSCTSLYLCERAALEYPRFTVDLKGAAEWQSRACPSLAALDLVDALQAQHGANIASVEVVWLNVSARDGSEPDDMDDPATEEYWRDWESCEAVVIKDRRYRDHALVRVIT